MLFADEQVGGRTGHTSLTIKTLLNMVQAFNIGLSVATQRPTAPLTVTPAWSTAPPVRENVCTGSIA
ncbi:MAG: hypothetical protein M3460_24585 [Actinomycetota bacterium]|nr:hypothetical protein [Actinomycetota bacterium]